MASQKISKKINQEILRYLDKIKSNGVQVEQAYLFGSHAKGTPHEWSDIDLCIISPQFTNWWETISWLWGMRLEGTDVTDVEPIGFTKEEFMTSDESLVQEIKRTGLRIL